VYSGTGGYGAQALYLYCDEGASVNNPHLLVYNNVIRHIAGDSDVPETSATSIYVPTGIRITGTATITQGIEIYNNSIYLSPDPVNGINYSDNPDWNSAITVDAGPTGIKLLNNIFYNTLGRRTGYANTVNSYAIWVKSTTSPFAEIDYNVYYAASGDNNYVGLTGTTQPPVNNMDITAWRTFTGQDVHSVWLNPNYQNDFLEFTGGYSYAPANGVPLPVVATDYNGDARDSQYPTIGAYEYPWQATWAGTGTPNTTWFNGNNWSGTVVPNFNMNVIVPTTPSGGVFPVISSGQTGECKTATLSPDAVITVQAGGTLNITNP
jgi:hypothetical protein